MHRLTVILTLLTLVLPHQAALPKDRKACNAVKAQIREIEARMRNGYTAAQGIRYDERLRKLKDKRYKVCR
ncbi:MAG: hypothetical protein ACR2QS_12565 [Woeseiaceae bacterium]